MQVTVQLAPTILGVILGPDIKTLRLNQKEMATLQRASDIIEQVRDRLNDEMGTQIFEMSAYYTIRVDEILYDYEGVLEIGEEMR
jgi:hypothetical protein